jgi:hypothetical protein
MPELPTFTASGQIRAGPVAAPVDASVLDRPARALAGLGASIQGAGQDIAEIQQRRQKEIDLQWATETAHAYDRKIVERQVEDAKNPRETEGQEFLEYSETLLGELTKAAPSKRAAQVFRDHGMTAANRGYRQALISGEQTRLEQASLSNVKSTADMMATYNYTVDMDNVDGAAQDLASNYKLQAAYIADTYGKTDPPLAAKMRNHLVEELATGTASTNPDFARQLVKNAPITEEAKLQLNQRIDSIEKDALETSSYNLLQAIDNSIAVGYESLKPVQKPSPEVLKLLPPNQAAKVQHDVAVANGTISKFSEVKVWNWREQQAAVASVKIEGDPVAQDVKANLAKLLQKSKQEQEENPLGWQLANDPEFSRIPANEDVVARSTRLNRMIALQGAPPEGTDEQQAKRYLGLPTGLQKALSTQEAAGRAQQFNSTPNQLTKLVEQLKSEYPDPKIAGMVWNDMQSLPESQKLKMGIRVAAAIEDQNVRNNFLGAMTSKDVLKTEDKKSVFETQLDGTDVYRRFVAGWIGDGAQRSGELADFRDSILKYSMFISAGENLKTSQAVDKAVKRVISDNYGLMSINGQDVPVYRAIPGGAYTDEDIELIQRGITGTLQFPNVDKINTDIRFFPLQPRLPGDKAEANRYLRDLIASAGTVSVEPDGKSATVYVKGEGENDFPFQLRTKDGKPIVFEFSEMMVRGDLMDMPFNDTEARKRETEKRLGIPAAPKIRGVYK